MGKLNRGELEESFARFERAAAKGHEESIWIVSVVEDVEMEKSALKEAFGKTEEPLGWYFAGFLSDLGGRERFQFDFFKKSAEGGCSWGQVEYGLYFKRGEFVEQDEKLYMEWLEKAANQNNPMAMNWLGHWFRREGGDKEKAVSYFRASADLGWKESIYSLEGMLKDGSEKELRQALIWLAKVESHIFSEVLRDVMLAFESGSIAEDFFHQRCYLLGWGLYWYKYGAKNWKFNPVEEKAFAKYCLNFYCSCVELQQKSILTFLLCWKQTTGGMKDVSVMIGKMVWEGRADALLLKFEGKQKGRGCVLF